MLEGQFDRLCYSMNDAARLVGVGKRSLYKEVSAGRLRTKKMGRRTLVPASALRDWLERGEESAKVA